jgi:hypothetical protein
MHLLLGGGSLDWFYDGPYWVVSAIECVLVGTPGGAILAGHQLQRVLTAIYI